MRDPLVSVVIPTYNSAATLAERAIPSVQRQKYLNLECIVVDDGSIDDTEKRVKDIEAQDARIHYIKKENGGQASARNAGMRSARGEFFVFHDHDDALFPEYVRKAVAAFSRLPKVSYMSSPAINLHPDGRETVYTPTLDPFWKTSIGNGWIFRASSLRERGFSFDETMSGFEDLDLHIQFHEKGEVGYVLGEPLRRYYLHLPKLAGGGSYSSSNFGRQADHFRRFMEKNKQVYVRAGNKALAWVYGSYASLCLKAGRMKEARDASVTSLRHSPSTSASVRLMLSLAGFPAYKFLYTLRVKHFRRT